MYLPAAGAVDAAVAAEVAVVAVALVAVVDSMAEAAVADIVVAVVVPGGRHRCRDLAVAAAAVLAVVTVVAVDRAEAWPALVPEAVVVLVLVVGRCNDHKVIGKGSAACQLRIDRAAESVNDRAAVVRARDREQAVRDRDRTLRVAVAVDQALAAVGVQGAAVRRKDNSTTSWI